MELFILLVLLLFALLFLRTQVFLALEFFFVFLFILLLFSFDPVDLADFLLLSFFFPAEPLVFRSAVGEFFTLCQNSGLFLVEIAHEIGRSGQIEVYQHVLDMIRQGLLLIGSIVLLLRVHGQIPQSLLRVRLQRFAQQFDISVRFEDPRKVLEASEAAFDFGVFHIELASLGDLAQLFCGILQVIYAGGVAACLSQIVSRGPEQIGQQTDLPSGIAIERLIPFIIRVPLGVEAFSAEAVGAVHASHAVSQLAETVDVEDVIQHGLEFVLLRHVVQQDEILVRRCLQLPQIGAVIRFQEIGKTAQRVQGVLQGRLGIEDRLVAVRDRMQGVRHRLVLLDELGILGLYRIQKADRLPEQLLEVIHLRNKVR